MRENAHLCHGLLSQGESPPTRSRQARTRPARRLTGDGPGETGAYDAHDGHRHLIEVDRPVHDGRFASELPLPESVGQHDDGRAVRSVVVGSQGTRE